MQGGTRSSRLKKQSADGPKQPSLSQDSQEPHSAMSLGPIDSYHYDPVINDAELDNLHISLQALTVRRIKRWRWDDHLFPSKQSLSQSAVALSPSLEDKRSSYTSRKQCTCTDFTPEFYPERGSPKSGFFSKYVFIIHDSIMTDACRQFPFILLAAGATIINYDTAVEYIHAGEPFLSTQTDSSKKKQSSSHASLSSSESAVSDEQNQSTLPESEKIDVPANSLLRQFKDRHMYIAINSTWNGFQTFRRVPLLKNSLRPRDKFLQILSLQLLPLSESRYARPEKQNDSSEDTVQPSSVPVMLSSLPLPVASTPHSSTSYSSSASPLPLRSISPSSAAQKPSTHYSPSTSSIAHSGAFTRTLRSASPSHHAHHTGSTAKSYHVPAVSDSQLETLLECGYPCLGHLLFLDMLTLNLTTPPTA